MRPITDILMEFRPGLPAGLLPDGFLAADAMDATAELAPAPFDPEAQAAALAEARQEGYDQAWREAEEAYAQRHAAEAEAQAEAQAAALTEARAQWAAEQGEALATALRDGWQALEENVGQAVAEALPPFIEAAARLHAVTEIRIALARLLAGDAGTLVAVRGPADLVGPLRDLSASYPGISIEETADGEVGLRAGDTTMMTQLAPWAARLRDSLEGPR